MLPFDMFCCETEKWTGRIPFRELKFFNVINGGDGLRNLRFSIVLGTRPLNGIAWFVGSTNIRTNLLQSESDWRRFCP